MKKNISAFTTHIHCRLINIKPARSKNSYARKQKALDVRNNAALQIRYDATYLVTSLVHEYARQRSIHRNAVTVDVAYAAYGPPHASAQKNAIHRRPVGAPGVCSLIEERLALRPSNLLTGVDANTLARGTAASQPTTARTMSTQQLRSVMG